MKKRLSIRNWIKCMMFLFLCACMLRDMTVYYASEMAITYQDSEFNVEADSFTEESNEMMPGDTVSHTFTVKNNSNKTVRMYVQISPMVDTEPQLLEVLQFNVSSNGKSLFPKLKFADEGQVNEALLLGVFEPYQTMDVVLDIYLSTEADNACKDAMAELEYVFSAEEVEAPMVPVTRDVTLFGGFILLFIVGEMILLVVLYRMIKNR